MKFTKISAPRNLMTQQYIVEVWNSTNKWWYKTKL